MAWRDSISIHPAADLFPLLGEAELRELGEDIKKNGLRNRVAVIEFTDDGPILIDGRNRLDAMELVGLEIVLEDMAMIACCRKHGADFNPYDYVISANIHRRHLTGEQRRDLIGKLMKAAPEKSDRQIANQTKASPSTVGKVRKELEQTGDVSKLDTRTDTKGRMQPASKPKVEPKIPKPTQALDDDERLIRDGEAAVDRYKKSRNVMVGMLLELANVEPKTFAPYLSSDDVCKLRSLQKWLDRVIVLVKDKPATAKRDSGVPADKAKAEALH